MVKKHLKFFLINLLVTPFLFFSCVNKDFDLNKDIDLNLHIGGSNLGLPIGSTDKIFLSKIIKVDESDVLHLNAGEYSLLKEDVINPVQVSIPNATPIYFSSIYLRDIELIPYSAAFNVPATSTTFELSNSGIPSEVKSIKSIKTQTGGAKAVVKFTISGLKPTANVAFNNFRIKFPDFIVSPQLNANHELVLNGGLTSGRTDELYITSFDFSGEENGALNIVNKMLSISKNVTLYGGVNTSNLTGSDVIAPTINLNTTIDVSPASISEIEGKVDPAINVNINPISLDIPDFLKDDAVTLDVLNPMIRLNATNELDIPVIINGTLNGYRDSKPIQNSTVTIVGTTDNPIRINANGSTSICLSKTGQGGPVGSKQYAIPTLGNIVTKVPDQIRFTMNAKADQSVMHKIQLGKNYNLGMNYAVEVPFKFGSGLSIVYNDTIDGANSDIKDFDVKGVNVTTTVENTIPLKLKLEATPISTDKKPISGISVTVTGNVDPCNEDGSTKESSLVIDFKEDVAGTMKNMDGLLLKATALSPDTYYGKPLRSDQYIRLKNIKAKATGVNVDLNDK